MIPGPGTTVPGLTAFGNDIKHSSLAIALNGPDNDLMVTARRAGTDLNGKKVKIETVALAKDEMVIYDADRGTLIIKVITGTSTAQRVI